MDVKSTWVLKSLPLVMMFVYSVNGMCKCNHVPQNFFNHAVRANVIVNLTELFYSFLTLPVLRYQSSPEISYV